MCPWEADADYNLKGMGKLRTGGRQLGFCSCWFVHCSDVTYSIFMNQKSLMGGDELDIESQNFAVMFVQL